MPGVTTLRPQIAVFSDETSAATRTFARPEDLPTYSSPSYDAFDTLLLGSAVPVLASAGAAVREFQLTDLLLETASVDWKMFKLCVFLNAFVLTPSMQAAIKTKLQGTHSNCTVVYQYAPGVFDGVNQANASRVSEVVGLPLARGPGGIDVETTIVPGLPSSLGPLAGLSYGHRGCCGQWQKSIDPWFHLDNSAAVAAGIDVEVLGTLQHALLSDLDAGLVRTRDPVSGHVTIFSAAPGLPVRLWRALAQSAGVHVFTTELAKKCVAPNAELWIEPLADSIELTVGGMLMYHAASTCSHSAEDGRVARRVALPFSARHVANETNGTVCENCAAFVTAAMAAGEVGLFHIAAQ